MNSIPRKFSPSSIDLAALRVIASYELFKAVLVVGAGVASLFLLRHDLHGEALHALRRLHLDPASRISLSILHLALRAQDFDPRWIVLGCLGYAAMRCCEAYGLWFARAWGEWIGALSGAVYVPIELREVIDRPTPFRIALLVSNLGIILFLCWRLRRRSQEKAFTAPSLPEKPRP